MPSNTNHRAQELKTQFSTLEELLENYDTAWPDAIVLARAIHTRDTLNDFIETALAKREKVIRVTEVLTEETS